jgi:hypothetical protein
LNFTEKNARCVSIDTKILAGRKMSLPHGLFAGFSGLPQPMTMFRMLTVGACGLGLFAVQWPIIIKNTCF